ncbi:YbhN family protein [Frankia sp. Cas3]|uniref:lysylphosphatidylglycerol synthase transmembrane domain-containing protein n=1 Tax=Frankia sp. Cas3 TaxID=3073926 RepID=UPI002AD3A9D0|nr:YbhN family protein [Frankia sp. Cas3]
MRELPGEGLAHPLALTGIRWHRARAGWLRRPGALIGISIAVPMTLLLVIRFRSEVAATLSNVPAPSWPWLVVCGLASALFFLANALALRAASGLPLRLPTAAGVQLAAAAANRVLPAGLGAIAVNVHYLERQQLTRSAGLSAVAAVKVAVALAHVAGIVLVAGLVGGRGPALGTPIGPITRHVGSGPALACVAGCLLGCVAVGGHPRVRARLGPPLTAAGRHLLLLARSPRRTAILLASAAGTKIAQIVALASCVWAFNGSGSMLSIATIYLIGAAVAGAVPTAGNVGALEPALALGLTAAGGEAASMLAAVLVYRLISYWLPVLPGAATLTTLRRRNVL